MKICTRLSQDRIVINYGDGRTVYKDQRHQVLKTLQPDGTITELVMEKVSTLTDPLKAQEINFYRPQFLSITDTQGTVTIL